MGANLKIKDRLFYLATDFSRGKVWLCLTKEDAANVVGRHRNSLIEGLDNDGDARWFDQYQVMVIKVYK
jgi:hypothetical protein